MSQGHTASMEEFATTDVAQPGNYDQDRSNKPAIPKTRHDVGSGVGAAGTTNLHQATNGAANPKEHASTSAPTSGLRFRHAIDAHKALTPLLVLLLVAAYRAWQLPAIWAYLATHGMYGVLWVVKSNVFPDKQWEKRCTPTEFASTMLFLAVYWVTPWLIVRNQVQLAPWYMALSFASFSAGVFLMFASDMQKHMHLKLRPGTLLCDGLWARCRNPNYVGELLIYVGFLSLAQHPLPLGWLLLVIFGVWLPGMRRKDASLARFPEFAGWKARSVLFIPGAH